VEEIEEHRRLQQALNGTNNEAPDEISQNFLEISLKVP
jgi:hypothetical protein